MIFNRNDKWHGKSCSKKDRNCFSPDRVNSLCRKYSTVLIKFVRFKLSLGEALLAREDFPDLHIVLLTRDPRAVMGSRWNKRKTSWCTGRECLSAKIYCEDLHDDLLAARRLQSKYPDRVHIVRYENMALQPLNESKSLLQKLGVDFTEEIESYITAHTNKNIFSNVGTVRVSRERAEAWKTEVSWADINKIQNECKPYMATLGYTPVSRDNITKRESRNSDPRVKY